MSSSREKSKQAAKELLALCATKGVKVPTVRCLTSRAIGQCDWGF